jgi:hypothetical protein
MSNLDRIAICHSIPENSIVVARVGKDPTVVLETRDAMEEFLLALVSYGFDGELPPVGESVAFNFGGNEYHFIVSLSRVTRERAEEAAAAIIAANAA